MILTTCAVCAVPLTHEAPATCAKCDTRYCSAACRHSHWRGGHRGLCPEIRRAGGAEQYNANKKYKEAVAVAVKECAEDTKGQTCYICLEDAFSRRKDVVKLAPDSLVDLRPGTGA